MIRKAVNDPHPIKRGVAGEALVRAGGLGQKLEVAKLLEDPVLQVRLQLALALVEARDKDAVAVLIERIADAPAKDLWHIEDLLLRLADGKAPPFHRTRGNVVALRDHWRKWWQKNAAEINLAKLDESGAYLGFTLITSMAAKGAGSKVVELRPDRSVHFEIDNLSHPVDARVIAPGRVLITEYMGRRVSERDFDGNILWEWSVPLPLSSQRLPGGDTFIATRRSLVIVDADKKEVFSHFHNQGSISAAHWVRDGSMVLVDSTGQCRWLDEKGKEIKSFQVGSVYSLGGNVEVLPNRHVVVPRYRDGNVAEFDADGKEVGQIRIPSPISATRLPNGNTLVVTMNPQRVVEIDPRGTEIWNHPLPGRGWRARGR